MNRARQRRSFERCCVTLLPFVLIAASACHESAPKVAADAGHVTPASTRLLSRVGNGTLTAHADDTITLTTLLVSSDGTGQSTPTPVPGVDVQFKITPPIPGNGSVSLKESTITSDSNGLSQNTVNIGNIQSGEVNIQAVAPDAKSTAVWTIEITPIVKHIRIIANPPLITLTDPASATVASVNSAFGNEVNLLVQVTEDNGMAQAPVPNETVTFSFVTAITGAQFATDPSGVVTTDAQGTGSILLDVGSAVGAYKLLATIPGNIYAQFDVTVSAHPPSCQLSSQCGAGCVCVGGECQCGTTGTTSATCGNSDQMCPVGYECDPSSNACTPITPPSCDQSMCPMGFSCDASTGECAPNDPQCGTNMPCPSGAECRSGICYPDNGSTVNVTGHWFTEHQFDVSNALPTWVNDLHDALRLIDEVLLGQIPGLPSIVDALIRGLVQQFIPPWVTTIVYLFDNILSIFSQLTAKGEMDLTAVGGPAVLYGTENWDSFDFCLLAQCGQGIGSPNLSACPPCGIVDVYTADLAQANFSTTVNPFSATMNGDQLLVDRRTVNLQLAGIIEYVINQVIAATTGYPSLQGPPGDPQDGALYNLIDCASIAQLVISSGIPIDITGLCQALVAVAADAIAQELSMITVSTNVLSFTGQATALCTPALNTPCPNTGNPYAQGLGYPDFMTRMPADGVWSAEFIGLVNNVPGAWRAARQPW